MYRIAVIDDEPKILKGLTDLLRKEFSGQAEIESFQTTSALLEYAKEHQIDILITDISMPDMDGLKLSVKLRMKYPFLKIIIISGYSRFDYAKTAISLQVCEYLLKPVDHEKMIGVVNRAIQELDSAKLAQLDMVSPEESRQYYEMMMIRAIRYSDDESLGWLKHYGFESCAMCFLLFEFTPRPGLNDNVLFQETFRFLRPTGYHQMFIQVSPFRFLLVTPQEKDGLRRIEKFLERQKRHSIRCSVGISRPVLSCEEIQTAYHQALSMVKMELYHSENRVYEYHAAATPDYDCEKLSLAILNHLISSEEEKLDRDILDLFTRFKQDHLDILRLQEVLKNVIEQMQPILFHNGVAGEEFEEVTIQLDLIDQYHLLAELEEDFVRFLNKMKDKIIVVKNLRLEQNLDQAIDYMKTYFYQDLSLEEVADHAGLNASYFSTTFKKYTGSNFVAYLMSLRIEHAKRLLRDPNYKILQIAQESGFHDTRYFAKIFKKNVGITPSEYRNIVLQLNKKS